jgi:hypothetical protein
MNFDYDEWVGSLRIVGDQALLPSERVPRPWHRLTDEEREHYNRDWMRRYRARKRAERDGTAEYVVIRASSLHSLRCTGPTRSTGCRCHKVRLFERRREVA